MKFRCATVVASALTAAIIGLAAPAQAAHRRGKRAADDQRTAGMGYTVIVNRLGSTPLDQATVVGVRPGQTYSRTDSGVPARKTTSPRPSPIRRCTWTVSKSTLQGGAPRPVPLFGFRGRIPAGSHRTRLGPQCADRAIRVR